MLPKQTDIEVPLLQAVQALGGKAKPEQVYERLTKHFSDLTDDDLTELDSGGGNKWKNRIRWVRQNSFRRTSFLAQTMDGGQSQTMASSGSARGASIE